MKLLITADFHIDENKYLEDTESALHFVAGRVSDNSPDYLVILGDIFNKRKPTPRELKVFNQWLMVVRKCVANQIVILEGNHDRDVTISSLRYLQDLFVDKIKVVTPPYRLGKFYFGHEQVVGATADNNIVLREGVSLEKLIDSNPECAVFAFGHFHKSQELFSYQKYLTQRPFCFYAGSITRTNFSERDDVKKLWIFEEEALLKTVDIPNRPMFQFDVALQENCNADLPIDDLDLTGALVKIVFSGTKKVLAQLDTKLVKALFFEQKKVKNLKIAYNVINNTVSRNENFTESMSEKEALAEFFKGDPNKDQIVKEGTKLIDEVNNG